MWIKKIHGSINRVFKDFGNRTNQAIQLPVRQYIIVEFAKNFFSNTYKKDQCNSPGLFKKYIFSKAFRTKIGFKDFFEGATMELSWINNFFQGPFVPGFFKYLILKAQRYIDFQAKTKN